MADSWSDGRDEFAQTRPEDDLFADDVIPIEPAAPAPPAHAPTGPRGRGRGQGRGRAKPAPEQRPTEIEQSEKTDDPAKPQSVPAVRGDRTNTGGVKKPKLTEEELSAVLEARRIRNQQLEEQHRKAEQDKQSFDQLEQEREQVEKAKRAADAKKRREQARDRKELDSEREKNRQRKLNAMGGREWDAAKTEEDYAPTPARGRGRGRGSAPVRDEARPEVKPQAPNVEPDAAFPALGRGGTNSPRGHGRGRGSYAAAAVAKAAEPATTGKPAGLGSSKYADAAESEAPSAAATAEVLEKLSLAEGTTDKSWAEQVENA